MSTIGFWTATVVEKSIFAPIAFARENKMQTRIDDYFFISGKKAYALLDTITFVFPNNSDPKRLATKYIYNVVLLPTNSPLWLTILKVVSYCTVIIPLIMLGLKIYCRCVPPFDDTSKRRVRVEYREIDPEDAGIKVSPDSKSGTTIISVTGSRVENGRAFSDKLEKYDRLINTKKWQVFTATFIPDQPK